MRNFVSKVLVVFVLIFSSNTYAKNQKVSVYLKWFHKFQFAGFYAAKYKGYYAEHGLDVKIVEGDQHASTNMVSSIIDKKYDFGIASQQVFRNFINDDPIVAIAQYKQAPAYDLYVKKSIKINSLDDLKGKILYSYLEAADSLRAHIYPDRPVDRVSEIVNMELLTKGITNDLVDGFVFYKGNEKYYDFDINTGHKRVLKFASYDFIDDILFTSKEFAESNPNVVEAFDKATRKGWKYALENQEEIIDYIINLPKSDWIQLKRDALAYEADAVREMFYTNLLPIGTINSERWQDVFDFYCKTSTKDCRDKKLDHFLFYRENNQNSYLLLLYYVMAAFIIVIVGLSIVNYKMRQTITKKTKNIYKELRLRKKTRDELKLNNYIIALSLEGGGIATFDMHFPFHEMIVNEQYPIQLGYSPENFHESYEHWLNNIHPDCVTEFKDCFDSLIKGEKDTIEVKIKVKHSSGNYKWLLCRAKSLNKDKYGVPERIFGVNININELKNAIELAERAKVSQAAILANLGHEVVAPTNSILGFAELLLDEPLEEKRIAYLNNIIDNCQFIQRLIGGIVEVSRADSGVGHEFKSEFSVNDVLNRVNLLFNRRITDKNIEYSLKYLSDMPKVIIGDPNRLLQIFTQVIGGALQTMNSGNISIEVAHQMLNSGQVEMSFSIRDTSNLWTKEKLEKSAKVISGEIINSSKYYSTGVVRIGIIKRIIDILNGSFYIEEKDNEGAILRIKIPYDLPSKNFHIENGVLVPNKINTVDENLRFLLVDKQNESANEFANILHELDIDSFIVSDYSKVEFISNLSEYNSAFIRMEEVTDLIYLDYLLKFFGKDNLFIFCNNPSIELNNMFDKKDELIFCPDFVDKQMAVEFIVEHFG